MLANIFLISNIIFLLMFNFDLLLTTEFLCEFLSLVLFWILEIFFIISTDIVLDLVALSHIILLFIFVLMSVAFFTLIERKVMSAIQRRKGPNVVGFFGLLQPFADGLKLFCKETIIPIRSNQIIFTISPIYTLIISLLGWFVLPLSGSFCIVNIDMSLLFIFMFSSLGVYGIIMAGWASNSKYAFLGGLRSTAQMISYELSIGLLFLLIILCTNSLNLYEIVEAQRYVWLILPLLPVFLIFCISGLAETNRSPFDLPEAEAELVSGYNVEYSGMGFALFFIAEYANMLLFAALGVICFLGGGNSMLINLNFEFFFVIKIYFFLYGYVWVRATFPRYRYDQLMLIGWKVFLPIILAWFFLLSGLVIFFTLNV